MKMLFLDEAQFRTMLRNPVIVSEFAFLKQAAESLKKSPANGHRGCGGCRSKAVKNVDLAPLRQVLATLPPDKKVRLKQLLGVERIRMYYTDSSNRRIRLTF